MPTQCVSGYLIFEWKNYTDRVDIIAFLFWLSCNILHKHINGIIYELIFVSKKLEQDLKPKEIKSSIVSQPCVVYKFASDLCDADYCNIFLYVIFLLMNYNYFSCIYRTFILDFFSLDNEDR